MAVSVVNEAYVFLAMVVLGMAGGLLFDCFRILRRVVNMKAVAVSLTDVLFWILAVVLIFGGIFKINSGQLRWYEMIGLGLGLVIYFCAFSRWIIEICVKFVEICIKFFGWIFKIVLTPLTFLYKILSKPFYWIARKVRQAFGSFKKRVLPDAQKREARKARSQMKKHKKKTKQAKKKSFFGLIVVIAVVVMGAKGLMQQPVIVNNKEQIASLKEQIEYEAQKSEELDKTKEKVNTDEYIEKVAREKLGLIKENEKIFIDVSGSKALDN